MCKDTLNNVYVDIEKDQPVYKSISVDGTQYVAVDFSFDLPTNGIALTRSKNGNPILLWVHGFIKNCVDHKDYYSCLVSVIPTLSGSSFLSTSLYGYISINDLHNSYLQPKYYIISLFRLQFDNVMIHKISNTLYSFYTQKLVLRQYPLLKDYYHLDNFLKPGVHTRGGN